MKNDIDERARAVVDAIGRECCDLCSVCGFATCGGYFDTKGAAELVAEALRRERQELLAWFIGKVEALQSEVRSERPLDSQIAADPDSALFRPKV